jgi:hypothetical protein
MADALQQPQLTPTQLEMLKNVEQFQPRPPPPQTPPFRPDPVRVGPDPLPGVARIEHLNTALLETAQAVSRILATRILLMIGVLTSSAVWGIVIYAPTQLGIIAAGVYSIVGVWPLVFLYLRKG